MMQFSFLHSNSQITFLHRSIVSSLFSNCLRLPQYHCRRPTIFHMHKGSLAEQSINDFSGTSPTSASKSFPLGNKPFAVSMLLYILLTYILLQSSIGFIGLTSEMPAVSYSLHALSNSAELHITGHFKSTLAWRIRYIFKI